MASYVQHSLKRSWKIEYTGTLVVFHRIWDRSEKQLRLYINIQKLEK